MWEMVIISLLTGAIELTEKGFSTLTHCESRAEVWRQDINSENYRVECIHTSQIIKPTPKNRHGGRI